MAVADSFRNAMREFQAEGRGGPDDDTMIGAEIREWQRHWGTPEGFAAYVAALRAQSEEETPRPVGWVPCTTWWWVNGPDYLGRIALRHVPGRRESPLGSPDTGAGAARSRPQAWFVGALRFWVAARQP